MTFREKLAQEHPESINDHYDGGCYGCPYEYGYELPWKRPCGGEFATIGCRACWDREIPMTPEEQEEHDLEINAEIIRAYCIKYSHCRDCPAYRPCFNIIGRWSAGVAFTSAEKQRAVLDAFESALPPLDEDDAERTDAPQNDHCAEHDQINHPSQPMQHDAVNHPSHYTSGKVECIDAIESAIHAMQGERAFLTGQVIKYLWRWPLKNGVEDLRKARWYLDRLIKFVEDVDAERSN